MAEIKKDSIESNDSLEQSEKSKKTLLQKIDQLGNNLGTGILSIEGHNSQQIWEQAYIKPTYEDYENDGKKTHIVVDKKDTPQNLKHFSFIIPSKKDK